MLFFAFKFQKINLTSCDKFEKIYCSFFWLKKTNHVFFAYLKYEGRKKDVNGANGILGRK